MNRITIAIAFGICASPWIETAQAGDIQGLVKVVEGLTKKRVTLPAYQFRGASVAPAAGGSAPIDEMSRVVIYLEGPSLSHGTPVTAEMKQHNRRFEPEILVIPAGSTVSFPNTDPIFHNVFSLSKIKQFDLGYYPAGQTRNVRFDKAGAIQVYCHLHPDMGATILVVPSDFHTRPAPDGRFNLAHLPAGSYRIVAWHKTAGSIRRTIQVPEQGSVNIEFAIPVTDGSRAN